MPAKKKRYIRALQPEDYRDALFTHGRRVANRLVLASLPLRQRTLSDFYACYSPQDGLPEHERCVTGLINKFDPAAWHLHYPDDAAARLSKQWPDPAGEVAASPTKRTISEETDAVRLRADIAHAARQIVAATSAADDEAERDERGNIMLSTLASSLAAKYQRASSYEIYNALVDEVNK
jgi:hypothetical protein